MKSSKCKCTLLRRRKRLRVVTRLALLVYRSIQDGRCDSPSLSSAGEDTWTLAAAIRRQERPVLGVHSTASIKTLIDQAARPRTPAA